MRSARGSRSTLLREPRAARFEALARAQKAYPTHTDTTGVKTYVV